jgi:hypothetical protein
VFGKHPLSNRAQELLAQERGGPRREDEALKSRAVARAQAALERDRPSGIGLRLVDLGQSSARSRPWLRTLPLIAAALAAAGLAAAGAGLYAWRTPTQQPWPPAEVTASPLPRLAVGGALLPAAPTSSLPTEQPAAPRAAPATATGSDGARSVNVKQYATELTLLEPARSSISHGDYATALSALDQHRREFPDGQLSQEREALRVRALWGLGQKSAALTAARTFRKRYPRSSLLGWLKDQGEQTP